MVLRKKEIQMRLNAALLLIVFSMNIIVGFACAVGLDRIFNSHHQGNAEVAGHHDSHHHTDEEKNASSKESKDNCCNDHVIKLSQVDKSLSHSFNSIVFFSTFITCFYNIDILHTFRASLCIKYFVRNYHPPIPDIRIAIQSFQI